MMEFKTCECMLNILSWFIGEFDELFLSLCVFMCVNIFTYILLACANKEYKLYINSYLILQKILIFLIVGLAHIIDTYLLDFINGFRTVTIMFYIVCEGISILENAIKLGLPIPESLIDFLKNIESESSKDMTD